jgi:ketosteroid isomerase-like protein
MDNLRIIALVLLLMFTQFVHSSEPISTHLNTVERFIAAFNLQDSSAMADLVANDIEWLSIAGEQVTAEARGKVDLIESMNAYFKSCPTCRSELSDTFSTTSRVSAVEVASWQGKSGPRSQQAISVYEFSGGLITRVYYFPAEN